MPIIRTLLADYAFKKMLEVGIVAMQDTELVSEFRLATSGLRLYHIKEVHTSTVRFLTKHVIIRLEQWTTNNRVKV